MPNRQKHSTEEELESYSLGSLSSARTAVLEEHLLLCANCRARLDRMEPYNYVHYTKDGPFYSRVTRQRNGTFFARHWGRSVKGGKEFRSRQGARAYLMRSFRQMFPEHVCGKDCGSTKM